MRKKRVRKKRDLVLEEFEKKDLGEDIRRSNSAVVIRPKFLATSIYIDPALASKLKEKAAKRGIGYQTMLKMIVYEHIDEY